MTQKGVNMTWRRTLKQKVSLITLILVVFFMFSFPPAANSQSDNVMDLVLLNDQGEMVQLGQLAAGKPLLLYFWATWCRPCRKARHKVDKFAKKYADRVKVLGINLGGVDPAEKVRKYRSRYKITYPLLLDLENKVASLYSIFAIPAVILLDSTGKIRYRGNNPPSNLEELLSD